MRRPGLTSLLGLVAVVAIPSACSFSHGVARGATVTAAAPQTSRWKVDETNAGAFNVVSCATARFCVAAGTSTGTDNVLEFENGSWGAARQLEQYAGEVVSLSCPEAGWCVAVTDLAAATILRDGHWSRLTTIDPNPGPPYPGMTTAVSCTSSRFCVAVDAQGSTETYNGTSWTKPLHADPGYPLNDISCIARLVCVAVDGGGRVLDYRAGHWSNPTPVDTTALTAISCAAHGFCAAVDLLGRAVLLTDSAWSHPTRIDTITNTPIEVSCWQKERCLAVDSAGSVQTLNNNQWTPPRAPTESPASTGSLVDVSCPVLAPAFCAAVDSSGNALTTTLEP